MPNVIPQSARGKRLRRCTIADLRNGDTVRLGDQWRTISRVERVKGRHAANVRFAFEPADTVRLMALDTPVHRAE